MSEPIPPSDVTALLEPCDVPVDAQAYALGRRDREEWKAETVPGWRFLHRPYWPLFMNIPVGGFLAELPGPCIMSADRRRQPWSVTWPQGGRTGLPARWTADLFGEDRILRSPTYRVARRAAPDSINASYVERDVPAANVRRGDLLVYARRVKDRPSAVRGSMKPLDLDTFGILKEAMQDSDEPLLTDLHPLWSRHEPANFLKYPNRWGKRLKVWHSRLIRVRPITREEVSRPIEADSDAAAVEQVLGMA